MYDYIKIIDNSKEKHITIAYSEPVDDSRAVEYIHRKSDNRCVKRTATVFGDIIETEITPTEFSWRLGQAVGEISQGLPT